MRSEGCCGLSVCKFVYLSLLYSIVPPSRGSREFACTVHPRICGLMARFCTIVQLYFFHPYCTTRCHATSQIDTARKVVSTATAPRFLERRSEDTVSQRAKTDQSSAQETPPSTYRARPHSPTNADYLNRPPTQTTKG